MTETKKVEPIEHVAFEVITKAGAWPLIALLIGIAIGAGALFLLSIYVDSVNNPLKRAVKQAEKMQGERINGS